MLGVIADGTTIGPQLKEGVKHANYLFPSYENIIARRVSL